MKVLKYVGYCLGGLPPGPAILICYGAWYGVMMTNYATPTPRIWFTALGMGFIVGLGFIFSGMTSLKHSGGHYWPVIRIFLIPFCVSSFSSIATSQGFVLIFAPETAVNLLATGSCLCFLLLWFGARQFRGR